ncbi:hypothetical protein [Gimesia aquarii]|uniref:Uncharacterized protein n=1 Tax=Gimesia aquarii TaxID=2527964 RepID=A0A517WRQ7_9PLAN|nr:hypothetical protein [Gimesia aquarii]QDU07941.1 hypothetical protein V202x_13020 [Gimesia aquarii]
MVFLKIFKNKEVFFLVPFIKSPHGASMARGKMEIYSYESLKKNGGNRIVEIVKEFDTSENTEPSELYNTMDVKARNKFLRESTMLTIVGKKGSDSIKFATEDNERSEPLPLDEPEKIVLNVLEYFNNEGH